MSVTFLFLVVVVGPWYVTMIATPLVAYNLSRYRQRDHLMHFITKREYKRDFKRMEKAFLVKSVIYGILCAASLVYTIMSLCDWITSLK